MNSNNSPDDFLSVTDDKLLYVAREILSKAETSTWPNGLLKFEAQNNKLLFSEFQEVIRKLQQLNLLVIWDEQMDSKLPTPYPTQYVVKVEYENMRKFIDSLEDNAQLVLQKSISWPEYYKWDEGGLNFEIGEGKKLNFQKKDSNRWRVFDCLARRKGDWVRVTTISEESGIGVPRTVRITLYQVEKKIEKHKLTKYLRIESQGKNKFGIPGAYRIVVA